MDLFLLRGLPVFCVDLLLLRGLPVSLRGSITLTWVTGFFIINIPARISPPTKIWPPFVWGGNVRILSQVSTSWSNDHELHLPPQFSGLFGLI